MRYLPFTTSTGAGILPSTVSFQNSHNLGSGEWVPRGLVSYTIGSFSTDMIMGGRVGETMLNNDMSALKTPYTATQLIAS